MTKEIVLDEVGCMLSSGAGWHNNYYVVEIAKQYGMPMTVEDDNKVKAYIESGGETNADWMIDQGGLVDEATEYLDSMTAEGYTIHWHEGELFLSTVEDVLDNY